MIPSVRTQITSKSSLAKMQKTYCADQINLSQLTQGGFSQLSLRVQSAWIQKNNPTTEIVFLIAIRFILTIKLETSASKIYVVPKKIVMQYLLRAIKEAKHKRAYKKIKLPGVRQIMTQWQICLNFLKIALKKILILIYIK